MDALDYVLKIEERLVAKANVAKIPIGGTFELLPLCNMNCDMCFIRLNAEEMKSYGKIKRAKEWLSIASKMKEAGTLFVLLTGGEPFLYPEFKELYTGLKELGMIITINTNGTLITEEMAAFLGNDKPRRINVTLYGASNETYSKLCHNPNGFDQVMHGIELLKKYNLDIKLNGSLVPENVDDLDDMIQLAKKLDLYFKVDTYMFPTRRKKWISSSRLNASDAAKLDIKIKKTMFVEEKFKEYQQFVLENEESEIVTHDCSLSCRAGKSSFWITWYGDMTPCVFIDQPAIPVFQKGFNESWNLLVKHTEQIQLPINCVTCRKKKVCKVCGASIYCENGDFKDKPEYVCKYTDTMIHEMKKLTDKAE